MSAASVSIWREWGGGRVGKVLDAIGMARRSDDKLHLKARLRGSELTDALSDRQLNGLWMHTFTPLERWTLFWKAPVVLYLVNVILVFSPPPTTTTRCLCAAGFYCTVLTGLCCYCGIAAQSVQCSKI